MCTHTQHACMQCACVCIRTGACIYAYAYVWDPHLPSIKGRCLPKTIIFLPHCRAHRQGVSLSQSRWKVRPIRRIVSSRHVPVYMHACVCVFVRKVPVPWPVAGALICVRERGCVNACFASMYILHKHIHVCIHRYVHNTCIYA